MSMAGSPTDPIGRAASGTRARTHARYARGGRNASIIRTTELPLSTNNRRPPTGSVSISRCDHGQPRRQRVEAEAVGHDRIGHAEAEPPTEEEVVAGALHESPAERDRDPDRERTPEERAVGEVTGN
jgi:hypothetical protein